jgi:hypothetical protein
MATQAQIDDLVAYYTNLLIIQYHNKPKAQATIDLFVRELVTSDLFHDIENAYDLTTSVGAQLDVLGKYIGVDRYYKQVNLIDFFGLVAYSEIASPPTDRRGFTNYANYDSGAQGNGTLFYNKIISANNKFTDDVYRQLLLLKIYQNYSNHSVKSIEAGVFQFFGTDVRVEPNGNMNMVYFINNSTAPLVLAATYKKLWLRPMAVGLIFVTPATTNNIFGFTDYSGAATPYNYGFSTYANYGSLVGSVLNYNEITQG